MKETVTCFETPSTRVWEQRYSIAVLSWHSVSGPMRALGAVPCIGSCSDPRLADLKAEDIATAGSRTPPVASYYSDCAVCVTIC